METSNKEFQEISQRFERYLRQNDLKLTRQRQDILQIFFAATTHLNAEELYLRVRKIQPKVGYSTVYRTLKLLKECNLAREHNFGDGSVRYENIHSKEHHDHLICNQCQRIVEFECEEIEILQSRVARENGFTLTDHRLEMYADCGDYKQCMHYKTRENHGV